MSRIIFLGTTTVGSGGSTSLQFTSIPQGYTDLILYLSLRSDGSQNWKIEFNSTSANLSCKRLYVSNTTTSTDSFSDINGWCSSTSQTSYLFSPQRIYISNYSNTTYAKMVGIDSSDAQYNNITGFSAGRWNDSAAITTIDVKPYSGVTPKFVQYTTATLYAVA